MCYDEIEFELSKIFIDDTIPTSVVNLTLLFIEEYSDYLTVKNYKLKKFNCNDVKTYNKKKKAQLRSELKELITNYLIRTNKTDEDWKNIIWRLQTQNKISFDYTDNEYRKATLATKLILKDFDICIKNNYFNLNINQNINKWLHHYFKQHFSTNLKSDTNLLKTFEKKLTNELKLSKNWSTRDAYGRTLLILNTIKKLSKAH